MIIFNFDIFNRIWENVPQKDVQLTGRGNEPVFSIFVHKLVRRLGPLNYQSSRSDFGFKFAEIFEIEKLLPASVIAGSRQDCLKYFSNH